jgi:hypothetical protein
MKRKKTARRFDPFYPVTTAAMEYEAQHLHREVDNYSTFSPADVEKRRVERHANMEHTWQHVCLLIESKPERDQRVLQALMFRDLWYVLELYKTFLQPDPTHAVPTVSLPKKAPKSALPFSEFLFDIGTSSR